MPTLLKQGTWCTTPKNLEFTDSTVNFQLWIGDVSTKDDLSENIFPLEGNILFFGVDVQTPSLDTFTIHLQKNGSTDVASIAYGASGCCISSKRLVESPLSQNRAGLCDESWIYGSWKTIDLN